MAIVKPSKKILEKLKKEEITIRKNISKADIFSEGMKTKFWKEMEETYSSKLKFLNSQIEEELRKLGLMSKENLLIFMTAKMDIENFLKVGDFAKSKDKFEELLKQKQTEIDAYAKRLNCH